LKGSKESTMLIPKSNSSSISLLIVFSKDSPNFSPPPGNSHFPFSFEFKFIRGIPKTVNLVFEAT